MVRQAPIVVTTAPSARNAKRRKKRNTRIPIVVRNIGGVIDMTAATVKIVKIRIARDIERGASDRAAMTEKSAAMTKIGKTRNAIVKTETSVRPVEMTIIRPTENARLKLLALIETRAVEGGEKGGVTAARAVAKEKHVTMVLIEAVNIDMVVNIDADEVRATATIATL
jgi:hypothetical protein